MDTVPQKALVFANGKPKDGAMVRRALEQAPDALIIAADGGARVARYYDLMPDVVIGDMDSLTADELLQLDERGVMLHRHPPEKDETDLELALKYAAEHGIEWVRIIGGIGGRFDQMLANVYLLALPELDNANTALVAGKQHIQLLQPGDYILHGAQHDTISLIPVGGDVYGITTSGLKYPLDDETLCFGPARGISNLMLDDTATIALREGLVLCVHTAGRA